MTLSHPEPILWDMTTSTKATQYVTITRRVWGMNRFRTDTFSHQLNCPNARHLRNSVHARISDHPSGRLMSCCFDLDLGGPTSAGGVPAWIPHRFHTQVDPSVAEGGEPTKARRFGEVQVGLLVSSSPTPRAT